MSEISDRNFVIRAVNMARDNLILNEITKEMGKFISEMGLLCFSTEKKAQDTMIRNYFKSIALENLERVGFRMNIQTPWGVDATLLDKNAYNYGDEDEED